MADLAFHGDLAERERAGDSSRATRSGTSHRHRRAADGLALSGALWHHLSYSIMRIGTGWILGTIAGVMVGFAIGLSSLARGVALQLLGIGHKHDIQRTCLETRVKLARHHHPVPAVVALSADHRDALRTERPYKPALRHEQCEATMLDEARRGLWDKELVHGFFFMLQSQMRAA